MSDRELDAPFCPVICRVDELGQFRHAGFSHVVSILDPDSAVPEIFEAFERHERLDLRFHDIIDEQPDMIVPNRHHIERLLRFGRAMIASSAQVKLLVHCQAGVSRSTAAALLLLAAAQPGQPESAMARLRSIAPNAWPNLRVIELGDALLDLRGQLVAAVRSHYADLLARYPAIGEVIAVDRHLRGSRDAL